MRPIVIELGFYRRASLTSKVDGVKFTVSGVKRRGIRNRGPFETNYAVKVETDMAQGRVEGSLGQVSIDTLDMIGRGRSELKKRVAEQLIRVSSAMGDSETLL